MAPHRPSHSASGVDGSTSSAASGSGLTRPLSCPGAPRIRTIPLPPLTPHFRETTHWLLSAGVLVYNVTQSPHSAQIPSERGHVGISPGQLALPATVPSWRRATLHFDFPNEWGVAIAPDGGGEVLTIRDVLAAVRRALVVEVTVEYATPVGVQRRRVRRIDLLGGRLHLLDVRVAQHGHLLVRLR